MCRKFQGALFQIRNPCTCETGGYYWSQPPGEWKSQRWEQPQLLLLSRRQQSWAELASMLCVWAHRYYFIPLLHLGIASPDPTPIYQQGFSAHSKDLPAPFPRGLYPNRGLMRKESRITEMLFVLSAEALRWSISPARLRWPWPEDKACPLWGHAAGSEEIRIPTYRPQEGTQQPADLPWGQPRCSTLALVPPSTTSPHEVPQPALGRKPRVLTYRICR